jgi:hypothetical protein
LGGCTAAASAGAAAEGTGIPTIVCFPAAGAFGSSIGGLPSIDLTAGRAFASAFATAAASPSSAANPMTVCAPGMIPLAFSTEPAADDPSGEGDTGTVRTGTGGGAFAEVVPVGAGGAPTSWGLLPAAAGIGGACGAPGFSTALASAAPGFAGATGRGGDAIRAFTTGGPGSGLASGVGLGFTSTAGFGFESAAAGFASSGAVALASAAAGGAFVSASGLDFAWGDGLGPAGGGFVSASEAGFGGSDGISTSNVG